MSLGAVGAISEKISVPFLTFPLITNLHDNSVVESWHIGWCGNARELVQSLPVSKTKKQETTMASF